VSDCGSNNAARGIHITEIFFSILHLSAKKASHRTFSVSSLFICVFVCFSDMFRNLIASRGANRLQKKAIDELLLNPGPDIVVVDEGW
jgi:dolichol kinase